MRLLERTTVVDDLDDYLGRLGALRDEHCVALQGLNARYVVSPLHVEEAVEKARRSFERGENVADTLSMEILLYAAGTRQIDVATRAGLRRGENDTVFVVVGEDETAVDSVADEVRSFTYEPDGFVYGDEERLTEFFNVGREEREAVGDDKLEMMVLERVALLDVNK